MRRVGAEREQKGTGEEMSAFISLGLVRLD